ncbi:AAA family ATPase [Pseudomonas sp. EA_65y_Pfl1_P120]|uniref:AAA family ATPase n=1 Tax=Pseudomonas sp. EA_65y_Pfl1_P120 TaxID=3088693 RepID=UPI0030DD1159
MNKEQLYTVGDEGLIPQADSARQAVDSLRGYVYQVTAAALAWLDIGERSRIFLEVAEDYATMAGKVLKAVQVKDTQASTTVTLNTKSVRKAIANFVCLTLENPSVEVHFEYFTTSEIGKELAGSTPFPSGESGLAYWRSTAKSGDISLLRQFLSSDSFVEPVRTFVRERDDEQLRNELLRRIHWNCGQPDLAALRREFNQRLIVVARERFQVPASESESIADTLLYIVLEKSIGKNASERWLTRADLITAVDTCTRISVPRVMLDNLTEFSGGLARGVQPGMPPTPALRWLIDGRSLPRARGFLSRPVVKNDIEAIVRETGVGFIVGTSGVGKTNIVRAVAEAIGGRFFLVDFRDAEVEETKNRLDVLLSRLGGLQAQVILLEDLNCYENPQVGLLLSQVFQALARRDIGVMITCYSKPTARDLASFGLKISCIHECLYFNQNEVDELVSLHGGDPGVWGQLTRITGAFGHPQLVHAFIAGMAARDWPKSEMLKLLGAGLSSGDVAAERDSARRKIVDALPEHTRALLYRLSLLIGNFDRNMAMIVAEIPPPGSAPGEDLDKLIGPWVETVGRDRYRISPLAAKFGKEMLSPPLQTLIHSGIAQHLIFKSSVDVSDVDKIITHSIIGKNTLALAVIATKLLKADESIISYLCENFSLFQVLETNAPIYTHDIQVAALLRMVQLKVLVAAKSRDKIPSCFSALRKEIQFLPEGPARDAMHVSGLLVILNSLGVANYFSDWFVILQEYREFMRESTWLDTEADEMLEQNFNLDGAVSSLFAVGVSGLDSVVTLEEILSQLNDLEPSDRTFYLSTIQDITPDYSVMVNGPWVAQDRASLDYIDTSARYYRMANLTKDWGIRALTLQCWIARAVMFDEHASDQAGALRVLDEAVAACGEDVLLARARAKIYWRAQDHTKALTILRGIADVIGSDNCVERTFALREAAISAAKTSDWAQAEQWFLESRESAFQAGLHDMKVMGIGLGADAAAAAFKAGNVEKSLILIGRALTELESIDPHTSLRSIYCHNVVRHTLLWLTSCIEDISIEVEGKPIVLVPGSCSNPEPPAAIAERPVAAMDVAWYMLAKLDVLARTKIGYAAKLREKLGSSTILSLEFSLCIRELVVIIEDSNYLEFPECVLRFVECASHAFSRLNLAELNMLQPARDKIPVLKIAALDTQPKNILNEALLAYAVRCASKHRFEDVLELKAAMVSRFGIGPVESTILARIGTGAKLTSPTSFEESLIDDLSVFCEGVHPTPRNYALAGIRSLQLVAHSYIKSDLIPIIALWQRFAWMRIISSEVFQLVTPLSTVPPLKAALSNSGNNESFLCQLMLLAADATALSLGPDVRADFVSKVRQ